MSADLVDRRQRLAACALLSAIDLPAPIAEVAAAWLAAAAVCPGVTVDQAILNSRRAGLERARDLVAECLSELTEGNAP